MSELQKEGEEYEFEICRDPKTAARCVLRDSFAIYQLDDTDTTTRDILAGTWLSASKFLSQIHAASPEIRLKNLDKLRRIEGGALLGLNKPSPHKWLFRILFMDDEKGENGEEEGVGHALKPHPSQPFPDSSSTPGIESDGELQKSLQVLVPLLDDLLKKCTHEIKEEVRRKRLRNRNQVPSDEDSNSAQQAHIQKKQKVEHKSESSALSCCPLDFFFYHDTKTVQNCSEHVDRGILICISLTKVAGLEVLSRRMGGRWFCPEEELIAQRNLKDGANNEDNGCSDMICILSGGQLKAAVGVHGHDDDVLSHDFPGLTACVHRVKQTLKRTRLSISYELRSKINVINRDDSVESREK